jgi:hypothetical protein
MSNKNRLFEIMSKVDNSFPINEIFGLSKNEKVRSELKNKIDLAKQEIQKNPPAPAAFSTIHTDDRKKIEELMAVRLNLLRIDLPTVVELLPQLFQPHSTYTPIQYVTDYGEKYDGYIPSKWGFLIDNDGLIRKESGVERLNSALDALTQQK